jgi:penicillin-binding protein 1A
MVRAYTVFANQGFLLREALVESIFDRHGKDVPLELEPERPVLSRETSFFMTFLLEEVVRTGTGRCAKALGVPAGGKTGTTDNYHDAWFIGFTKEVTCGVWVGYDNLKPLGRRETGGRAACPLWLNVMQERPEGYQAEGFDPPAGVVFVELKDFDPLRGEETIWFPMRESEAPALKNSLPRSRLPKFLRELLRPRLFW